MLETSQSNSSSVNFHQLETKIKMHPEAMLQFSDNEMVTLQNLASDKGLNIKFDIMLILYPMVNWITVEQLIQGWPQCDQEKIINYLFMMHEARIIMTEVDSAQLEDNKAQATGSELNQEAGEGTYFHLGNHLLMLQDTTRIRAYENAIQKLIKDDTVAMDLGTGTGILALLCAKAGARKVYAVERQLPIAKVASAMFEKNNVADKVTILGGRSQNIPESELEEKPTVIVSEILGDSIFNEMILEFTIDARKRFLAPNGKLIPAKLEVWGVPYESMVKVDYVQQVTELESIYGIDFSPLKDVIQHRVNCRQEDFIPHAYKLLSEPICLAKADLMTIEEPVLTGEPVFTCSQSGQIKGFCLYFKVWMDEEETLSLTNSPWAPNTHWSQLVLTYSNPIEVEKLKQYQCHFKYKNGIELDVIPFEKVEVKEESPFIKII